MKRITSLPLFERPTLGAIKPAPGLRRYQERILQTLRARWIEGKRRMLFVGPCGVGKMRVFAELIRSSAVAALFVVHRRELIDQCANELRRLNVTYLSVIRGDDDRFNPDASIHLGSIDTLSRRDRPKVGLILIDEAHRAASDQYRALLEEYPDAVVIGGTASACRLDGKPLGDLFESIDIMISHHEAFKGGYIVEPIVFSAPLEPDLSGVNVQAGDYVLSSLEPVMSDARLTGQVVDHFLRMAHLYPHPKLSGQLVPGARRRGIGFAVDVAHSMDLTRRFVSAGIRTAHLDGNTPDAERRATLDRLRSGDLEFVWNCNLLLEGIDIPAVKLVIHARPTKSLTLWIQSTMRMCRPWCSPCGKPTHECGHLSDVPMLLDHAKNWDEHGAPFEDRAWSLTSRPARLAGLKGDAPTKKCPQCFGHCAASRYTCPFCGFEFPPSEARVRETQDRLAKRSTDPDELKRAFYDRNVERAYGAGFKPGYAAAQFKERYGVWPPDAWCDVTKARFASDPIWQHRLDRREAAKAAKKEALNTRAPEFVEEPHPEETSPWMDE